MCTPPCGCRRTIALERLTYDRTARAVTYRSDKADGPTAGTETVDPLEFLARVLVHIPDKGQVTTRYEAGMPTGRGACATRRRRPAPTGRRR
ncbi:MAG: transposase, partial [Gammaproteobacteria bacterium]